MCGRFTNELTWSELHALYKLSDEFHPVPKSNMQPRYNIAPTQDVDFVHLDKAGNREINRGRWWLVPWWATEAPKGSMFNARIETADSTPAFREAFKRSRCLVPADGYFEWTVSTEDKGKDPWLLQLPVGRPFSFAGLWARNDNLGITSCTIITAPAVPEIAHIHTRMPVIIDPASYDRWLSCEDQGDYAKALLLGSQMNSQLQFHRVAREVNNSRYEGTDTKKPLVNSL
ncbi:MAG TPA: SOS response-associated peptidase [Ramlibacter sp.]|jgi:putative SOS response-associated peptidase YedK